MPLDADSFPSDAQMMNSFGMVVVNGFDVNTLSDAQKAALEKWIKNGGIVVVGGGAQAQTDYPWFTQWTGSGCGRAGAGGGHHAPAHALCEHDGRKRE